MKIEFDPTTINKAQATFIMNTLINKFGCIALEFKGGDEDNICHEIEDAFLRNGDEIILSLAEKEKEEEK